MSRHSEGLEEAVLIVASGGAQRNPRWGGGEYVGLEEVAMPAAGLRPERVRRDESRLYVADFLCGRGDSVQTVRLTPPPWGRLPRGVLLAATKMPMRGSTPNCGRQESRPS